MNDSIDFRVVVIAAAGILVLALCMFERNRAPSEGDDSLPLPKIAASVPPPAASSENGEKRPDSGSSYAAPARMAGVSVVASNGQYSLNAIHVAVPGAYNEVEHLSGTDPKAIQYLQERDAAHAQLAVDNGPLDVDTSLLPPPGTFSNQVKRVGVKVKSQ
jgi:hypothetical protein